MVRIIVLLYFPTKSIIVFFFLILVLIRNRRVSTADFEKINIYRQFNNDISHDFAGRQRRSVDRRTGHRTKRIGRSCELRRDGLCG